MDKKLLRVIVIDDSPDDAELVNDALRRAGYLVKTQRVHDIAGLRATLGKGAWDAVISESDVPNFSVSAAQDVLHRAHLDLPFIVLTGSVSDADLIKLMHEGVHDIVSKTQTARLAPVLERELRAALARTQQQASALALAELENKHRALVEGSQEAVGYCHDGMHTSANAAYLAMFGYDSKEELGEVPLLNLIDKADQAKIKEYIRKPDKKNQAAKPRECTVVRKSGERIPVQMAIFHIDAEGDKIHQIIVTDLSKHKNIESKIQFLNQHDPLTGLLNRHYFLQELDKAVTKAKSGSNSAMLYINLEQLARINTDFSYVTGDRLLLKVTKLFRDKARERDLVARFGGDEFTLLLGDTNAATARTIADDILQTLKKSNFSENGKNYDCNCTIIVTPIDAQSENSQRVLTQSYRGYADSRARKQPAAKPAAAVPMAAAKAAKAQPESRPTESAQTSPWKERIRSALDNNGLSLMFQPIVNLHGDAAESYEVLLRLQDEHGATLSAAEFIPAAEQLGLSKELDHWVVTHAIAALKEHQRAGTHTDFFINLSVMALKDETLALLILQSLKEAGLKTSSLVFEIREDSLIDHARDAATFIDSLKRLGCRFAVDDYGSRLSAFGKIQQLDIDFLKLDGALIENLTNDNVSQTIVQALFQIGKAMNKRIIAKSVQDAESLALLWNYGADYVQGNYFQPPSPQLDYVFAGESIDSDQAVAGWAKSGG